MITKIKKYLEYMSPRSQELTDEEFLQLVPKDRNGFVVNTSVYRGSSGTDIDRIYVDASKERKSANVKNYYTLWINNHEDWSGFPKRRIICSSSYSYAAAYAVNRPYRVYPTDVDAKFGVCPTSDIWGAFTLEYKKNKDNTYITPVVYVTKNGDTVDADLMRSIGIMDTFAGCSTIISKLNAAGVSEQSFEQMKEDLIRLGLYEVFATIFSPKGFQLKTFDDVPEDREVWTDVDCVMSRVDI